MTTLENDGDRMGSAMISDPDTRMTMNFQNREAVGFDNKPFEFEDIQMK